MPRYALGNKWRQKKRRLAVSVVFSLGLAVSACAPLGNPIFIDEDFSADPGASIVVMPVVDARFSKLDYVLVSRNVRDALLRFLRDKGYLASVRQSFANTPKVDLTSMENTQLFDLAADVEGPVMLVQVDRLEHDTEELGDTYSLKLSGFIVDRAAQKVLWEGAATGISSLNGLLTILARGSAEYEAAVNASRQLVSTIPDVKE